LKITRNFRGWWTWSD